MFVIPYGKPSKKPENAQTESGRVYRHEQQRKQAMREAKDRDVKTDHDRRR